VEIGGHVYTCDDRTARWVQVKRGTTFDIFTEDYDAAVEWGVKKMEVTIME
jgi:3D (Asp-Asp-Asp) domain-containing protein